VSPRDKLRRDVNETAFEVVRAATRQGEKPKPAGRGESNPTAAARGRAGGRKGGAARAAKLTPQRRSAIARKAAKARWPKP
jgi:hypothetical protein